MTEGNGTAPLDLHDIQGLVVSGYAHMTRASYLLLRVPDGGAGPAREWLGQLAKRVTVSTGREGTRCLNVALTAAGLTALGVADTDLRTFPPPFREGMAAPHRRNILGDVGPNDPEGWEWGGPRQPAVHVLLMVFAEDDATFDMVEPDERARAEAAGLEVIRRLVPEPLPGKQNVGKFGLEHFGFADGMSQPAIAGTRQADRLKGDDARRTVIAAGEFVLGYENGYGQLTTWPRITSTAGGGPDFGRNGTFLVFRHLKQDVAAFWGYVDARTRHADGTSNPEAREKLAAKMVGRWPSGAPLVKAPHRDDPELGADNSFAYRAWDPDGERCPVSAHIRRTNPRDSLEGDPAEAQKLANLHRIMRRARVYGPGIDDPFGPDDGVDRGLFFLCLNANIERQFEFMQDTWCNNPKFGGRYDEIDPVIGNQAEDGGNFTVQGRPVRRRYTGLPTFVTTRGGEYFFLPGVRALRCLAAGV